jgi:hypothetical protein
VLLAHSPTASLYRPGGQAGLQARGSQHRWQLTHALAVDAEHGCHLCNADEVMTNSDGSP